MRRAACEAWPAYDCTRIYLSLFLSLSRERLTPAPPLFFPARSSRSPRCDGPSANGDAGALRAPPRGFIGQITRTTNIPYISLPLALFLRSARASERAESLSPRCVVTTHPFLFLFPSSSSSSFSSHVLSRLHVGTLREKRGDSRHGVNRVYPSRQSPWRSSAERVLVRGSLRPVRSACLASHSSIRLSLQRVL